MRRERPAYQRFWLPAAVAKNGSARWVYLPAPLARKIGQYCAADRAEVIAAARSRGAYDSIRDPLVIETTQGTHPGAVLRRPGGGEVRVKLDQLTPAERARLLIRAPDGLEPAVLWLGEQALRAPRRAGRLPPAHAPASFAVLTLEQLQRGHIAELAAMTAGQRGQYSGSSEIRWTGCAAGLATGRPRPP